MTTDAEPPLPFEPALPEPLPAIASSLSLDGDRLRWRDAAKWVLGALLALDLFVLFAVLGLANVTAEGPARRSLEQSVAILTEVDGFLDEHYEALGADAERSDEALTLADFPIELSFTAQEVRAADREGFRALLLSRAADRVHDEGVAALREDGEGGISFFSTQGIIRTAMDFLRPTPHRVLTMLTIGLASLAGVLALALVVAARGYGRLLAVGISVFGAAAPFLILAIAVRFAFRLGADGLDEYLAREFFDLGRELTWAAIRNGIIFSAGGAIILASGVLLSRWSDAARRI